MIYIELIFKLSLLVALSVISGFIEQHRPRHTHSGPLLQGLLFGGAAMIGMLHPVALGPGLIFDGRSVMLSIGALFYGPWAALVAGAITIVTRLMQGGAGSLTGVVVILASLAIGLLTRRQLNPDHQPLSVRQLYLFGLVVHLAMLAGFITLPPELILPTLQRIGPPVLLLYPLATLLVGKIISDQEALRVSEENYRRLFEDHAAIKLIIDPDSGAILDANQAAADFYGWSREELKRMRIEQINTLSPAELQAEMVKAKTGKRVHFEFKHRRADGSVREVAVFSSKTMRHGRPVLHSIVQDISEQEKLRNQLLQVRKMEAVGQLAGGVAHEFNNMMTIILANSEYALKKLAQDSPYHEIFTEIQQAAERSAETTRQLLAFARRQMITPRILDLNAAINGLRPLLQSLVGEQNELRWLPGKDLWQVRADMSQIQQILVALCVNARNAIDHAGVIVIETANLDCSARSLCRAQEGAEPGEYVRLTVRDNGRGIDQETLAKIFEPFFTTRDVGQGSGLGLAAVYGMIKQNRGFIDVESKPGQGTTVAICLPRQLDGGRG